MFLGDNIMSLELAKAHLEKFGLADQILEFTVSSATVELAAAALNCTPSMIAKTLSFIVEDKPILIVIAGDYKIDNPKFKERFNTKAKMIPGDMVEDYIGHSIGGVCPFGVKDNVTTYLDESLKEHTFVYPACGSSNSAIKLSIENLEKCSMSSGWVSVTKKMEQV